MKFFYLFLSAFAGLYLLGPIGLIAGIVGWWAVQNTKTEKTPN
jgi:hypothetical protein